MTSGNTLAIFGSETKESDCPQSNYNFAITLKDC